MTSLELKEKRKSSLTVVLTLGVAALFTERIRRIWMTNLFEGTSLMNNEGCAFVLKALSFVTLGVLTAVVLFIVHLFKVIYYSIEISRYS